MKAINDKGVLPIHRKSFKPVAKNLKEEDMVWLEIKK